MARDFYPFVDESINNGSPREIKVEYSARIAVYDDEVSSPRVVEVEPKDVRAYLEEITSQVYKLAREQGGTIPFMVIREIVENLIHAYFKGPTISILNNGNTIRFSDRGPGIKEKDLALEFGTSSATEEMKKYIRGVGSGLPYVQQYMENKGGSLKVEDNISGGTIITINATSDEGLSQEEEGFAAPVGDMYDANPIQQQIMMNPQMPYPTYQQSSYPQYMPGMQQAAPMPNVQPQAYPQMQQPMGQTPVYPGYMPQNPADQIQNVVLSNERNVAIIRYLKVNPSVGATDLYRAYGQSTATWTRSLQSLTQLGIIQKSSQKYIPTAFGTSFIQNFNY